MLQIKRQTKKVSARSVFVCNRCKPGFAGAGSLRAVSISYFQHGFSPTALHRRQLTSLHYATLSIRFRTILPARFGTRTSDLYGRDVNLQRDGPTSGVLFREQKTSNYAVLFVIQRDLP